MNANSAKREMRNLASLTGSEVATQAMDARRAMLRAIQRAQNAPLNYRAERVQIARRHIASTYLAGIEAIRNTATRRDLQRLQVTLCRRLDAGAEMPSNPKRDRLWTRLLAEYELVHDALSRNAIGKHLDRLTESEDRS